MSGVELIVAEAAKAKGLTVTRRFPRNAYRFEPETETWAVLAPAPTPLIAAAALSCPRVGVVTVRGSRGGNAAYGLSWA